MDYQAMQKIVEKIDNQELLLQYYVAVNNVSEADKQIKSIFDSYMIERNYQRAICFAEKYKMDENEIMLARRYLREWASGEFNYFWRQKNFYHAMETAKKYDLGPDLVEKSALAFFEDKINNTEYDPAIIVMVAKNELNHLPEKLTQAVQRLFDQKLDKFDFSGAREVIKEYPKFIDQNRKDLLEILIK